MLTFKEFILLESEYNNPSHIMLKPNGERRYISHNSKTNTHVTHAKNGSEVKHHPSFAAAHKHLSSQGYTQQHTAKEYRKDSIVNNTTSKVSGKERFRGDIVSNQKFYNDKAVGRRKGIEHKIHPGEKSVRPWNDKSDPENHEDKLRSKANPVAPPVKHNIQGKGKGEALVISRKMQLKARLEKGHISKKSSSDIMRGKK